MADDKGRAALEEFRAWACCTVGFAILPLVFQLVIGFRFPAFASKGDGLVPEILLPAFVVNTSAFYEYLRPAARTLYGFGFYIAALVLGAVLSIGIYVVYSVPVPAAAAGTVSPQVGYAIFWAGIVSLALTTTALRLAYVSAFARSIK